MQMMFGSIVSYYCLLPGSINLIWVNVFISIISYCWNRFVLNIVYIPNQFVKLFVADWIVHYIVHLSRILSSGFFQFPRLIYSTHELIETSLEVMSRIDEPINWALDKIARKSNHNYVFNALHNEIARCKIQQRHQRHFQWLSIIIQRLKQRPKMFYCKDYQKKKQSFRRKKYRIRQN